MSYFRDDDDILQELEQLNLESSVAPDTAPIVLDPVPMSSTSKSLELCDDEETKKTGKKGKKGKKTRYSK